MYSPTLNTYSHNYDGTSSITYQSRNTSNIFNTNPRTNSSMGRSNLAQRGAIIMKEDSRSNLESLLKEEKLRDTVSLDIKRESKIPEYRNNKGIVGLRNIGNSCYINSIIQCLIRLPNFRDALQSIQESDLNYTSKLKGKLALAFKSLINEVKSSNISTVLSPFDIKTQIGLYSRQFAGYDQQDSSEFFRCVLEALNLDLSRISKKAPYQEMTGSANEDIRIVADRWWNYSLSRDCSLITDFFQGQSVSLITCAKCKHGSVACDSFFSLTLPTPEDSYRVVKLEECLNLHFKLSVLPSEYKCEKCKVLGEGSQTLSIFRFPRVLVLQLKRFQVGSYYKQRLNTEISYPEELNLGKFKHERAQNPPRYMLYGISHHIGSLHFGHYLSHCKDEHSWYCFDDSRAYSIDTPSRSNSAYLLFYVAS